MAFVFTGFVAVCFTFASIILSVQPSEDVQSSNRLSITDSGEEDFQGIFDRKSASIIDDWISLKLRRRKFLIRNNDKRKFWLPVSGQVLLSLSDQQLLTGLAVLIAGFINHCSISVYHVNIVSELAWFSSSVHITTLEALKHFFQQEQRRTYRNLRVCLMGVMLLLMIALSVMQGHKDWVNSWNSLAQCLFDDLIGIISGTTAFWICFDIFSLLYGYGGSVLALYNRPSEVAYKWLFKIPENFMDIAVKMLQKSGKYRLLSVALIKMFTLLSLVLRGLMVIFDSEYIDFAFVGCWFARGVAAIRSKCSFSASDIDGDENEMTFGQIVPILLLSSIILTFRVAYDGEI